MKTKGLILAFLVTLLSLATCKRETVNPTRISSAGSSIAPEVTTTDVFQAAIDLPADTPAPSATPTQHTTSTATATQAALSSLTPTPVSTATPPLPDWIAATDANILMLYNRNDETISFFNVASGVQHSIRTKVAVSRPMWLWHEGRHLLSPKRAKSSVQALDTATGEFIELEISVQERVSPDGRYTVNIEAQEDRTDLVTIIDQETNTETELYNPFLPTLNKDFNEFATPFWSPDGAFLSVSYVKSYYSDREERDHNLAIYTPDGELFRTYVNVNTTWRDPWNSHRPYRILHTNRAIPCILEVVTNERNCLQVINKWADSQNVTLLNSSWSPDGKAISYVYGDSETNTGLCYFEFATQDIVCPVTTNDLQLEEQLFARIQFWSPDSEYLVLFFDELGFMDVVGPLRVGIINIEDGSFQILEGEYSWPYNDPWRPPLPAQ